MGQAAEVEPGNGTQGVQVDQDFELVHLVDVPISFFSFLLNSWEIESLP